MVADIKELQKMDASEIYTRRINALEVLVPQTGEHFMFTVADGTAKLLGNEFREPTPRQEQPVGSEDLSGELQSEPEGPRAERRNIPCSTEVHRCNKVYSHKSGRVQENRIDDCWECGSE